MAQSGLAVAQGNRLKGILTVTVLEAEDLPKGDYLGGNDSYAVVHLNEKTEFTEGQDPTETCLQTQVQEGKHPIWNEKLPFPVPQTVEAVFIDIFDSDKGKDDLLASGQLILNKSEFMSPDELALSNPWLKVVKVNLADKQGGSAGYVRLILHFVPQSYAEYMSSKFNKTTEDMKKKAMQAAAQKITSTATNQVMSYVA